MLVVQEIVLFTVNLCIIQQIVTMPIYGQEALVIFHPYMTGIAVLRSLPYLKVHSRRLARRPPTYWKALLSLTGLLGH